MSQNSWRKYKVKTRGLDPNPIAPAQSKCCLPLSTNVQDITETDFPGAPASRERWYILVMISKKGKQITCMSSEYYVHILFTLCSLQVLTECSLGCSLSAHKLLTECSCWADSRPGITIVGQCSDCKRTFLFFPTPVRQITSWCLWD